MIVLGAVPGLAEDSARDLVDTLNAIDTEPDPPAETDAEQAGRAARHLAGQTHLVVQARDPEPRRAFLRWISHGRFGRRRGWPRIERLDAPWQDTVSAERSGWRMRSATLSGESAFRWTISFAAGAGSAGSSRLELHQ
ncbi:hypothetical protein [Nonomuraea jiangxiensis]|uniref:Uncharacterized protein n=1 Tax=Nonomuraea jiangxiensis TaxID=633440 RepID=A0A1G8BY08_9ACTN|nr:hypothetical protein [Nonomuraea jiangxiensis]SDH38101.1 hypothetical protein SAMN05421869_102149 [Nonomuraea jiangxiensis]